MTNDFFLSLFNMLLNLQHNEVHLACLWLNYMCASQKLNSWNLKVRITTMWQWLLSPRFFKKAKGILQSPPSVCPSVLLSVMLSHPKPLDKIQPNLVCELLTWMGRATSNFFLAPPPGALGRGQKVKYHLNSITKSISKIFIPNSVCVLTKERYKTYQTGFSFWPLGHAPGVGLWGTGGCQGGKKKNFQTWSCGISNRQGWRAEQNASKIFILGSNWWPWGEVKGQIFNFGYHVNFKDFYTKLCVCSHK